MTDASIIKSISAETVAARPRQAPRDDAPAFSYALAAASLETNAGRSLEAHGARPAGTGDTSGSATPAAAADAHSPKEIARAESATSTTVDSRGGANSSPARSPAAVAADRAAAPSVVAAPPVISPAATPLIEPGGARSVDAAGVREAAAAQKTKATPKAARPTAAPPQEFAAILAKRLEKTSVFDIRLDPPELGRVEGKLTVGDDGKAVLSLAFDNQAAFDFYSRDEQALRQALMQAGLEFGAGDFVFRFRERSADSPTTAEFSAVPELRSGYDPLFFAGWSAGALDIRI